MGTAKTSGRRAERMAAVYAQRPDLAQLFASVIASMEAIEEQLRNTGSAQQRTQPVPD